MTLEQMIKESVEHECAKVPVPPVDSHQPARHGRRTRRTRLLGTSAMAAVVVAGLALVPGSVFTEHEWTAGPGQPPTTSGDVTAPKSVDGPTELFHTRTSVFFDGEQHPAGHLPWGSGAHVSANGIAYAADRTGVPYLMDRQGTEHQLGPNQPAFEGARYDGWVAADSSGSLVAWGENAGMRAQVVVFDTDTMREVTRKELPCTEYQNGFVECPRPYVVSDGIVFVDTVDGQYGWNPTGIAGVPEWFAMGPGSVAQAHNKTITTFVDPVRVDELGPDWKVVSRKARAGMEGLLSFDGRFLVDANGTTIREWEQPANSFTFDPPGEQVEAQYDVDGSVLFVTRSDGLYRVYDCTVNAPCRAISEPMEEPVRLINWDS